MAAEARHEYDRLARDAAGSIPRLLATAEAFAEAGLASRAIGLAQQARARGAAADVRTYRALYPMMARDVLRAESERHGVEAPLVAALVRQESSFDPRAVSRAGALGLMQLMPEVGQRLAAARQFAVWDRALLFQPDVNIQLGTAHLADLLRAHPHVAYALAAYNAGGARVARWSTKRGAVDPEVFAERIPFVETRNYVRIVQRNRGIYDALYGVDTP
jgi:soluble lytic murein transglycosylase